MKASELIWQIAALIGKHGDMEVRTYNDEFDVYHETKSIEMVEVVDEGEMVKTDNGFFKPLIKSNVIGIR